MLPLRILLMFLVLVPEAALAQNLNAQKEALQIIGDSADRLCLKPPLEGSGSTVELSGTAKAELEGLLKKLGALGIQGSAKYQQSQFQGLLQKDLAAALKSSTDCRLKVFDDLKGKLLSAVAPPTPLPTKPLALTFTGSPLFTRARKERITDEWSAFYRYLDGVGFDLPKDVPPLRTTPGNAMTMALMQPSVTESGNKIGIPEQWLDDAERLRNVYAVWLFRKLFRLYEDPPWVAPANSWLHSTTSLFACYYRSSFVNQNVCDYDWIGRAWNNGLWNIRVKKGQDFTDRAMFATYKGWAWVRPEKPESSFDEFFGLRFWNGLSLSSPTGHASADIEEILRGGQ